MKAKPKLQNGESMSDQRNEYVRQVLRLYLDLPDTPSRYSRYDRALAQTWFDQGISLQLIEQALILAQVRRGFRRSADPPLRVIRSLHYFVPIIAELQRQPMSSEYLDYLLKKMAQLRKAIFTRGGR